MNKTQIKINGIELNVPESEAIRLVKEYGEPERVHPVTIQTLPRLCIRPWTSLGSPSCDTGTELIWVDLDKGAYGPLETLTHARALTVAALEKLGVVKPEPFRRPVSYSLKVDCSSALSLLDDLIQGAEQEAVV